ncbi:EG45-like domain containing protein [Pyrus ussuriensis x Pyrus communis]|uniref:EG45-like domain containing protein n=2 Tax=Pyrus TaxID=3766 RepID=A0A5N5GWY1_9ROSA|nr:EG45-like domain containing protein isoform X2 [Pyrus x bretschneideri]KAB2619073.1 EG45-like domain containing protein [Pyrus ussuriensis x Pyrus communis]
MSKPQSSLPYLLLFFFFSAALMHSSQADVGTAAQYRPPYLPTACGGSDQGQFPPGNLFASVGEGIWDNGAACGRQYQVRCISAPVRGTCVPGNTIQVKVVDRALSSVSRPSRSDATIVLSTTAFAAIANSSATFVNIEFQQI